MCFWLEPNLVRAVIFDPAREWGDCYLSLSRLRPEVRYFFSSLLFSSLLV
jgi:hypothetical protein